MSVSFLYTGLNPLHVMALEGDGGKRVQIKKESRKEKTDLLKQMCLKHTLLHLTLSLETLFGEKKVLPGCDWSFANTERLSSQTVPPYQV